MRRTLPPALLLTILIFTAVLLKGALPQIQNGVWAPRGAMAQAREFAGAALLPDGRMLVTGGTGSEGTLASAETYGDFGTFAPAAPMNHARTRHASTVLRDGHVLVSGGTGADGTPLSEAEIYDPASDSWTVVAGGTADARSDHAALRLQDGKVLVVGGQGSSGPLDTVEIFCPRRGAFRRAVAHLSSPRADHAATLLGDGKVLVVGGFDGADVLSSVDLYDPASDSITPAGNLSVPRRGHSATTLPDGRVLVVGGNDGSTDLASAEIYDPATQSFSLLGSGLADARRDHSAFLLPHNGSVLIVGGSSASQTLSSAELFLPWSDSFQTTGSLAQAPGEATGGALNEPGTLLVAGGGGSSGSELYGFACVMTDTDDYGPGETALINGRGFQPNEEVTLEVDHLTGGLESGEGHEPWTVVADPQGDFTSTWYVHPDDSIGSLFKLTAESADGVHAETAFKDGPKVGSVSVGSQSPAAIGPSFSATYVVTVGRGTGPGAFTATLSLTSTLPSGATASFSPNPVSFTPSANSRTATLTITTTSATPGGVAPFTVKAATSTNDFALGDGSLTIDDTGPDTTIGSQPSNPTNSAAASFIFTGSDDLTPAASLTFECDLDSGGFSTCVSPKSYSGLSDASHTFRVRAKDQAGNVDASAASFTWTVDTMAPTAPSVPDLAASSDSGASSIDNITKINVPTFTGAAEAGSTVKIFCDGVETGSGLAAGGVYAITTTSLAQGARSITATATDVAGNTSTGSGSLAVTIDTSAPVIAAHATEVHEATSAAGVVVTYASPATSDAVDGAGVASCAPASGGTFALGDTSVTCNATDVAGNAASSTSFIVKVQDTTAPLISAHADMIEEATGAAGAVVTYTGPSTSDAVAGAGIATCSPASGTTFGLGDTTVTCHASDAAGNAAASTSFIVRVQDTTPPVIAHSAQAVLTAEASSAAGAVVAYDTPSTSDAVDGAGVASCSPVSGSTFVLGETTVTCHATDAAGNSALPTTFIVRVQDTTAPVISVRADMIEEATSAAGAAVTYVSPSTSDVVDGAGVASCSPVSGSTFVLGETTVTCHATDAAGNSAISTSFIVRIQDTTPPVIAAHSDTIEEATSAAGAVVNYVNPSTTDAVDGAGVASCSPVSGSTFVLGETTVTCHAADAAGNNATSTSFIVRIQDTTAPVISAHADMIEEATSAAGAAVTYVSPSTSDVVDGAGIASCSPVSGSTFSLGETTVTCHAADAAGNNAISTSFIVRIQDTTAPVIAAHADMIEEATSAAGAVVSYLNPSTSDAVDGAGIASCLPAPGTTLGLGDTTITCHASDVAGNAAVSTSFLVKVQDTTAPIAQPETYVVDEDATLFTSAPGVLSNDADFFPLTAVLSTDASSGVVSLQSDGAFSYIPSSNFNGEDTFTYRAGDTSGNHSTAAAVAITVRPVNDAPSFTMGASPTVTEDAGPQSMAWATSVSAGPADEAGQALTFLISNDNNAMFGSQPMIAPDGTLSFTPAANANGSTTVTVKLRDNGGAANGGVDTSGSRTFTITVQPSNDMPSFSAGASQTILEDAGPQTVGHWATGITPGPSNESSQTVDFVVTNDNHALFSEQPAVSSTGALTFTPAANADGIATVEVRLHDNGGVANGGIDTSGAQTFTISVTAVNDAPSFVKGPGQSVARDAGPQTVTGWASSISAGPPNESGQSVSFVVTNDNNGLFAVQPKISSNGTLTYTPAATSTGPAWATVSVQLHDSGGTSNGGVDTNAVQTFTIHATYDFTGFFQPIDNAPTMNRVNSGAAVPVKFSLAGNQGPDIFAAGYPASVKVNCETGGLVDDVEVTETAGASSLSYDTGSGQYKYVWKTEKSWSNSCRQLVVRFKDGTADRVVSFRFK